MRHTILLFFFSLSAVPSLFAQQTEDAVVPIAAVVDIGTPTVTLNWELNTPAPDLLLIRRDKDADTWFILLDTTGVNLTSFTDPFVTAGQTYEYALVTTSNGIFAFGYLTVSLETPVVDQRGTMLIFVEEALQSPLITELERLEYDLAGDGWKVIWHTVVPGDNIETVKTQIVEDYDAAPTHIKSVLLLGEIPVPYSGNSAWDGHDNHQGAWPADTYYGDIDGVWTDNTVNNTTPSRAANDNVPGDGKFDQSIAPTATELAVGRVDFSNLNETTFGTSRIELMRRYLDKNHAWRTKQYTVSNQAMVDDNFGYFGGEAFAANGYRNFYPLVGKDSVVDAQFFQDTKDKRYLFGYGCGGGSYTSASGVGNSNNFAADTVHIAFTMLFGSYHGDWDSENNPFMPSALASKGGILSCSWAGRPHWFYHHMAAGETLGYCALASQNACENAGYFNSIGNCGAHVTLLGDPSLRAHVVDPATDLATVNKCNSVELTWMGSSAANLEGYLVYRSGSLHGDYSRLTPQPITTNAFTDNNPLDGDNYFQVRAVALQSTPSGSYFNTSTGVIANTFFESGTLPAIAIAADTLTCTTPTITIAATTDAAQPSYLWSGPGGFTANTGTIVVNIIGEYTLTVTDGVTGCTNTAIATIVQDVSLPVADPAAENDLNCFNNEVQLFANPDMNSYTFQWSGPNNFTSTEEDPIVAEEGIYTLVVSAANGCSTTYTTEVFEDINIPEVDAIGGVINCITPEIQLDGTGSSTGTEFVYQWTTIDGNILSGVNTLIPVVDACGTYIINIVNTTSGCSASTSVEVACDLDIPELSIDGNTGILCAGDLITVTASSTTTGATFEWEGPGITDPTDPTQVISDGAYTITAIGTNGCTNSQTFEVAGPAPMQVSIQTVLVDCFGFEDVSAFVTGGSPPYTYDFSPMPPYPPNSTFEVTVTDANGCTIVTNGMTPVFEPLTISISFTNETVSGFNDGTATVEGMNGTPPFTYTWSNDATTQTITDLAPGIYSVTITDANGCEAMSSVEILEGIVATENIPGLQSLSLFPNPTYDNVEISLILDGPKMVSVEIMDIIGRVVEKMPEELAATKTWRINLGEMPAGIYLCNIRMDGKTISRRMVKY